MQKVRIMALGGLDEDGKNMYVIEIADDIFVVEAGIKYPESAQLGVEYIIPDFSYLVENKKRIKCVFITHGCVRVMVTHPAPASKKNLPPECRKAPPPAQKETFFHPNRKNALTRRPRMLIVDSSSP